MNETHLFAITAVIWFVLTCWPKADNYAVIILWMVSSLTLLWLLCEVAGILNWVSL